MYVRIVLILINTDVKSHRFKIDPKLINKGDEKEHVVKFHLNSHMTCDVTNSG